MYYKFIIINININIINVFDDTVRLERREMIGLFVFGEEMVEGNNKISY